MAPPACSIPESWAADLPKLDQLWLHNNSLNGELPKQLPRALTALDLSENTALGGALDAGWKLPPELQTLDLSGLALNGTIPAGWALPGTLWMLDLSFAQLRGPLPTDWERQLPEGIENIYLHGNALTGGCFEKSLLRHAFSRQPLMLLLHTAAPLQLWIWLGCAASSHFPCCAQYA
jgi:hypothetical protein